jgi:murein DD-endopeptidase MepM/ murein hydrolase activator NlpD
VRKLRYLQVPKTRIQQVEKEPFLQRMQRRMKDRYRLVFLNDGTFEEKFSFRLTRGNLFVALGVGTILLFTLTFMIISNTALRYWVSGYRDVQDEKLLYFTQLRLDSQERALKQYDLWLTNFQKILVGEDIADISNEGSEQGLRNYDTIQLRRSPEDSILRAEFSQIDPLALTRRSRSGSQGFIFFPPLKGTVINGFNPRTRHFAVDIAARENEAVKATLNGTVILATWSSETGWTIMLQHADNMVSVYKHNSALLKRQGEYVKAGDPIAIYGGSGNISTGPHLHFELWFYGNPVDPQDFMVFE